MESGSGERVRESSGRPDSARPEAARTLLALVPAREHPSVRYRIAQFEPWLAQAGLDLQIEPLSPDPIRRIRQMLRPKPQQVVLIQRKLLPLWQLAMLRATSAILVYDVDDAVFLHDSFHSLGSWSATRKLRFQATVRMADIVITGNDWLAEQVRRQTRRAEIRVIPTCLDVARYGRAEHAPRSPTKLVWIGSPSTLRALERGRETLEAIGRALPDAMLRIICNRFPSFRHLRIEPAPWSPGTEVRDLSSADIGISLIPDDIWSRGKCGLKILQYMAAGLPVLASPVGVHPAMLDDGSRGFLPRTPGDWIERARTLVVDPALRLAMGSAARRHVETEFDVRRWGPVFAGSIRQAAGAT
jgi:glycosyltransferase involved in cell wall biosynthesis